MRKFSANAVAGLLIFLGVFAVFRLSPRQQVADSAFTMLFSEQLLWHGTFAAPRESLAFLDGVEGPRIQRNNGLPYQLHRVRERIYYYYPPGSTVLSLPFVLVTNLAGLSSRDEHGRYSFHNELRMQRRLAPLLMAGLALVTFVTLRLLLPLGWSVLITAATAFASPIWSSASRAVMADTWGVFLLGLVVWLLVRAETRGKSVHPILLATLMAWLYFAKPTYCIAIVAVTVYLSLFHRRILLLYLLVGGLWLAAFVTFSEYHFGTVLPAYYGASRLTCAKAAEAFPGLFLSPSRGLIISMPILCFIAYLLVRYWRWQRWPRLVWLSVSIFAAHVIILTLNGPWWGGHSYGPRLMTGVVPWLALLGALALDARLRFRESAKQEDSPWRWRTEFSVAAVLLLISVSMQAVGAFSVKASLWNVVPNNIDEHPERLWDWKDAQFLAPLVRR